MNYKILLDTDIGDDIDDALALSLAFSSEEVEVVGITTVMRDTVKRGKTVKKLLILKTSMKLTNMQTDILI